MNVMTLVLSLLFLACLGGTYAREDHMKGNPPPPGLNFLAMGDWGCDCLIQYGVAREMGEHAKHVNSSFTVALGDNFYESGIHGNAHSERFHRTFEKVYTAADLHRRWYVIGGNHDHLGNISAEIAYTKLSSRWYYPSLWYDYTVTVPGTAVTVQTVLFDTVIFAGDWPEWASQPLGMTDFEAATKQLQWLNHTLATSTADWILVGGHYPVWSIAEHGPTKVLVDHVKPLLEKYGVAFYMDGHDHNMQHLVDGPVSYFVTGNGGKNEDSKKHKHDVPAGSSKFFHSLGGYMHVNIVKDSFECHFRDVFGHTVYSTGRLPNPRKKLGLPKKK